MNIQNDPAPTHGVDLYHPVTILMATRWEWADTKITLIHQVRNLLQRLVDATLHTCAEHEKLQRRGHLTEAGLRDVVRALAVKEFVPQWRAADMDAWRKMPVEIGFLKHQMIPQVDKADFAGAVLRSDLRRLWMALAPGERIGLLVNPTRDLTAALLEMPGALIGLNEHDAALLQGTVARFRGSQA